MEELKGHEVVELEAGRKKTALRGGRGTRMP